MTLAIFSRWPTRTMFFALCIIVGVLYLTTLAPSVLWGDSAGFQRRAYMGEIRAGTMGHPLWVAIAHPITQLPFYGDPARRANLLSALSGTVTVILVAVVIYQINGSLIAGVLGAGVLAISHTFWLHSVITEVYTLHLAMVTAAAWLMGMNSGKQINWTDVVAWFLLVLSLSVHLLTLPLLPAFLYFTISQWRMRQTFTLLAFGLLGLVPLIYWELNVPALGSASGKRLFNLFFSLAFWQGTPRYLGLAIVYFGYQFLLSSLVGVWGMVVGWCRNPRVALFWLFWLLGSGGFAFIHRVPDQYVFYLPTWVAFAVFCGLGYENLLSRLQVQRQWGMGVLLAIAVVSAWVLPVGAYRLTREVGANFNQVLPLRPIPYRDTPSYFFWPPKIHEVGAREYINTVFSILPQGALLLADWTLYAPLAYAQQVEGQRPDVYLVDLGDLSLPFNEFLSTQPPNRPLYLADINAYYPISAIETSFKIAQEGVVYSLKRLKP